MPRELQAVHANAQDSNLDPGAAVSHQFNKLGEQSIKATIDNFVSHAEIPLLMSVSNDSCNRPVVKFLDYSKSYLRPGKILTLH